MGEPKETEVTEFARSLLTMSDAEIREKALADLAHRIRTPRQRRAAAEVFLKAGPNGHIAALEWLARWRGPFSVSLFSPALAILGDRKVSASLRVRAAAGLLRSLPDRLTIVRAVTKAITVGLSPLRSLERLRHLQNQVAKNHTLDELIARKEQRIKIVCPKCKVRLRRVEMVKHLWHAHHAGTERGELRTLPTLVGKLKRTYTTSSDPAAIDRVWLAMASANAKTDPLAAYQGWLDGEDPTATELAPLLARAAEHRAGLCPACFGNIPASLAELPAPLAIGPGRVAGGDYTIEVTDSEWFRRLRIRTPTGVIRNRPDRRHWLGPRAKAAVMAFPILLAAILAASLMPAGKLWPALTAVILIAVAFLVHARVLFTHRSRPHPTDRAFDAGWTILAKRLIGKDEGISFLVRLCRTSLGRGDPVARAGVLKRLREWADKISPPTDQDLQLQALAAVLQLDDAGRLGRDRVAGIADLAALAFFGNVPLSVAEYALGAFLDRPDPPTSEDRARLRVLILASAFDAGLKPRDLLDLGAVAPALKRAASLEPSSRLGLLHAAWAMRSRAAIEGASAYFVFDLCRFSPNFSGEWITKYPDLLFMYRPPRWPEDTLGPILLCGRGVVIGGKTIVNPKAVVERSRETRGGQKVFELTVGAHCFELASKPEDVVLDAIRELLCFRHEVLLPFIDHYLEPQAADRLDRLLKPLGRRCGGCGRLAVTAVGQVGVEITPTPAPK